MVRKYLRHERQRRGWSQDDLARAAGIKSRTTIQKLENGLKLSEGIEGAVEEAVGWKIGSLDVIRDGGEPISAPGEIDPDVLEIRAAARSGVLRPDLAERLERFLRDDTATRNVQNDTNGGTVRRHG